MDQIGPEGYASLMAQDNAQKARDLTERVTRLENAIIQLQQLVAELLDDKIRRRNEALRMFERQ